MPRTSPSALLVKLREVKADPELADDVRANLATYIRGFARRDGSQAEMDVQLGLIEARRALLATIPTLRGVERVYATVRVQEQIAKAYNSLRRSVTGAEPMGLRRRKAVPTATSRSYNDDPEEIEDNGGEAADGGGV